MSIFRVLAIWAVAVAGIVGSTVASYALWPSGEPSAWRIGASMGAFFGGFGLAVLVIVWIVVEAE